MREDLSQLSAAGSAPVAAWPNGAPLSFIDFPASATLPGVFGKCPDRLVEPMADGDTQAIVVHGGHLAGKVRSVIRSSLEHVELPLVNDLMRQRAEDLLLDVMASLRQLLQQWE